MIDLRKDTPVEYSQQSRDYQVFRFVYNALMNQIKMYADLTNNVWTDYVDDKLLPSRSFNLNFIPLYEWQNDDLRGATNYFKHVLRTKGTKDAILQCLFILSRIKGISANVVDVQIENGVIRLIVDERIGNEYLAEIEDLFRYIFPAGMLYEIVKHSRFDSDLYTSIVADNNTANLDSYQTEELYMPDSESEYNIHRYDNDLWQKTKNAIQIVGPATGELEKSSRESMINYETGMIITDGHEGKLTILIYGNQKVVNFSGLKQSVGGYVAMYGNSDVSDKVNYSGDVDDLIAEGTNIGYYYGSLKADEFSYSGAGDDDVEFKIINQPTLVIQERLSVTITAHTYTGNYNGDYVNIAQDTSFCDVSGLPSGVTLNSIEFDILRQLIPLGETVDKVLNSGHYTITPKNAILTRGGVDVTNEFDIRYISKTTDIIAPYVRLQTFSDTKVYDGTPLIASYGWTFDPIVSNTQINATVTGSQTNVGSSQNTIEDILVYNTLLLPEKKSIFDEFYYRQDSHVRKQLGTLTVTPALLTILTDSESKVYDGTPLTASGRLDRLVNGETATLTITGSQLNAGESENSYTLVWDGTALESNYSVLESLGKLRVLEAPLKVTIPSQTKVYDGTPLVATGTLDGLVNGETATFNVTGSLTNVGELLPSYSIDWDGTALESNYVITSEGIYMLSITPKAVTVKAENKTKVYGEADEELTATVIGLVGTDTIGYNLSRDTGEDVGTYTITPAGEATQGNYTVTYETGTYTISPKVVTVTADNKTKKVSDPDPVLTATVEGLIGTDTIDYSLSLPDNYDGSVGIYDIIVTGDSEQGNYTVSFITGTLTVEED